MRDRVVSAPWDGASRAVQPLYRRLLVAVDGSESSLRAGEHAVHLAESLGAELFVMSVGGLRANQALRGIIYLAGVAAEIEQESGTSRTAFWSQPPSEASGARSGRPPTGSRGKPWPLRPARFALGA